MPTRRKFRRNNRKSRRRGKRGGADLFKAAPLPIPKGFEGDNLAGVEIFPINDYNNMVTILRNVDVSKWSEKIKKAIVKEYKMDMEEEAVFAKLVYNIDADKVADYYLNKALTMTYNIDNVSKEWVGRASNDDNLAITDMKLNISKPTVALLKAKATSETQAGKNMEHLMLLMMNDLVLQYNKIAMEKIVKINGLKGKFSLTKKGDIFKISDGEKWEAQNCFFTAGDTSKLASYERMAMSKKGKQPKKGYLIGKILGTIGENVGMIDSSAKRDVGIMRELTGKPGKPAKFGLDGITGLRNSAILLYLCSLEEERVKVVTIKEGKTTINTINAENAYKKIKNESFVTIKKDQVEKAIKRFKGLIKNTIVDFEDENKHRPNMSINLAILEDMLSNYSHDDHWNSGNHGIEKANCGGVDTSPCERTPLAEIVIDKPLTITFPKSAVVNPQNATATEGTEGTQQQGGRKRRRRKRRTRRGGKSRRKRRKTRRRRRR